MPSASCSHSRLKLSTELIVNWVLPVTVAITLVLTLSLRRRARTARPARCGPRTPRARGTPARWTRSRARRRFGARCGARTPDPPPSPATAATRATPPSSRRSPTPSPSQHQPDTHLLKIIYLVFSVLWIIQPTNQKIRIRVSLKILVKKNKMK